VQEQEAVITEFTAQLEASTDKRLLKEEVDAEDIAEM
jgi:ATP-dependent Clp protease ATP-binding subunit ClpB